MKIAVYRCGLVVEFVESAAFGLVIDVLLEVAHLVGDEAEDMVQRDPLEVGLVFVEVFADGVEFGEEGFGFHALLSLWQRIAHARRRGASSLMMRVMR